MARSVLTLEERVKNWREGVKDFNSGRYWQAHEAWEKGWLSLPSLERLHVQALIQTAGALHLQSIGRKDPGRRLAESAGMKLKERDACGAIQACFPRVEISEHDRVLKRILDGESQNSPQSRLLLSPP